MSKKRASIVIVNWKTPRLLEHCLNSIFEEDSGAESFEVFVIDNASGDGSAEMVQSKFPQVILDENTDNLGFSKGCNQAIRKATGDHIFLLNPDTVITRDAVSKLVEYLDTHPEAGAVGPKVLNPDGTLQLACRRSFPSLRASFFRMTYLSRLFPKVKVFSEYNLSHADPDLELEVDALSGSAMMVRGSLIKEIGLLDEDIFMHAEDLDWCWRIRQTGRKVIYFPDSVIYHAHGAASRLRPIRNTISFHKGMEVFYRKHLAKKYWAPVNLLVYAAIWSRAGLFILVNLLTGMIRRRQELPARDALPAGWETERSAKSISEGSGVEGMMK